MAAKKRKPNRATVAQLGGSAAEVYETAEKILKIRDWFACPVGVSPSLGPELLAAQARFEERLASDPVRAVAEHNDWAKSPWKSTGGKALRDERLAEAVLGIAAAFEPNGPSGIYGELAIRALGELGFQTSRAKLIKLASTGAVVRARQEGGEFSNGGMQAAAIAMVSIITGFGVQTVKRAVLGWRKRSKAPKR